MTWTHLSVKKNKSTASSACSFYYLFLASRRVYKTAPYCISWSYPLPPFISVWRLSFRRHDAAPRFAKPCQSPLLNMQWPQKCSLPPSPSLHRYPLSLSPPLVVSPRLSFPAAFFTQSSRATGALGGNTGPCQRIHWICCTIDPSEASWGCERDGGGRVGGMEGSGEQGGRVNVKSWPLHQGSVIENNTAKSQLEQILFKFTPPSPVSQCCEVGKMRDCSDGDSLFFFYFLYL